MQQWQAIIFLPHPKVQWVKEHSNDPWQFIHFRVPRDTVHFPYDMVHWPLPVHVVLDFFFFTKRSTVVNITKIIMKYIWWKVSCQDLLWAKFSILKQFTQAMQCTPPPNSEICPQCLMVQSGKELLGNFRSWPPEKNSIWEWAIKT